jgi:hypothetical protein
MDLHYSIRDLDVLEERVNRSIKSLRDLGTLIGEEHNLTVIKKLLEENRTLRDELIKRYGEGIK